MAKPSSPTAGHRGSVSPLPVKLYTYRELEFGLLNGGQQERRFNIKWMKATPLNDNRHPGPEPTADANRRRC
jgi:hypothetical protein